MKEIEISLNPLAEYMFATDNRRRRIIIEQSNPDSVKLPYYHKARASMVKCILNNMDWSVITDAKEYLSAQKTEKGNWRNSNKFNSIEALGNFENMVFPDLFQVGKIERIKTDKKYFFYNGVMIKVSPSLIFRIQEDGVTKIGAVQLHLSKGKMFNHRQSAMVAQILQQFLSNFVALENEVVDPRLCICLDPFAGTTIAAFNKINFDMKELKNTCLGIPGIFDELRLEGLIKEAS